MKRTLLFLIPVLLVIFLTAFYTNSAIAGEPENGHVKIKVIGCDNCHNLNYCIDGGPSVFVGGCVFDFSIEAGNHSICIKCGTGTGSLFQFGVKEGTNVNYEVNVLLLPTACNCDGGSKKK
jgi:hypothetical protein